MPILAYPIDSQIRNVNALYGSNTFYVALIDSNLTTVTVPQSAINAASDLISITNDFVENMRVVVTAPTGATLPGPFNSDPVGTVYYVFQPYSSQFYLSRTKNTTTTPATRIDITTQGTGGMILTEQPLGRQDGNIGIWIRHEISDYKGSSRQVWTPGNADYNPIDNVVATVPKPLLWYPTTGDLANIRYLAFLKNSSQTAKYQYGDIDTFLDLETPQIFKRNTSTSYAVPVQYTFG